jgi:hypothetical protein
MVTGLTIAMLEFDAVAGDDIAQLDAQLLGSAFAAMCESLVQKGKDRQAIAERWKTSRSSPHDEGPHRPAREISASPPNQIRGLRGLPRNRA